MKRYLLSLLSLSWLSKLLSLLTQPFLAEQVVGPVDGDAAQDHEKVRTMRMKRHGEAMSIFDVNQGGGVGPVDGDAARRRPAHFLLSLSWLSKPFLAE